jgi:hypothetical protein
MKDIALNYTPVSTRRSKTNNEEYHYTTILSIFSPKTSVSSLRNHNKTAWFTMRFTYFGYIGSLKHYNGIYWAGKVSPLLITLISNALKLSQAW